MSDFKKRKILSNSRYTLIRAGNLDVCFDKYGGPGVFCFGFPFKKSEAKHIRGSEEVYEYEHSPELSFLVLA